MARVTQSLKKSGSRDFSKTVRLYSTLSLGRTGHRSIEALRKYERTGEEQHQAVSSMLSSPVELPYSSHLVSVCYASTPSDPQQSSSVSLPQIRPPVLYHGPSVSSHCVRNQHLETGHSPSMTTVMLLTVLY